MTSPDVATPGNGLLLFFRVDDSDSALTRARTLVVGFEDEPHTNPNTRTIEFSLRDPDGYYVTISAFSSLELKEHTPINVASSVTEARARGREYLLERRQSDGRWLLDVRHHNTLYEELAGAVGAANRWVTMRALRVLNWYAPQRCGVRRMSASSSRIAAS